MSFWIYYFCFYNQTKTVVRLGLLLMTNKPQSIKKRKIFGRDQIRLPSDRKKEMRKCNKIFRLQRK